MSLNFALKLLEESKPYIITVETKNGKNYRGKLKLIEENMNCHLQDVVVLHINGNIERYKTVFIRGNSCKLFIIPDLIGETPLMRERDF
jgi:small nuclear ribonucleoprotein (snRNP)-like protein